MSGMGILTRLVAGRGSLSRSSPSKSQVASLSRSSGLAGDFDAIRAERIQSGRLPGVDDDGGKGLLDDGRSFEPVARAEGGAVVDVDGAEAAVEEDAAAATLRCCRQGSCQRCRDEAWFPARRQRLEAHAADDRFFVARGIGVQAL